METVKRWLAAALLLVPVSGVLAEDLLVDRADGLDPAQEDGALPDGEERWVGDPPEGEELERRELSEDGEDDVED